MASGSIFDQIAKDPEKYMIYLGEALLKEWSDNSAGESVSLWLDGESDVHPFKQFKASYRTPGGSRFLVMVVEISDDEMPVNQEAKAAVQNAMTGAIKGGKHSQHAALMCRNTGFHEYLVFRLGSMAPADKRAFHGTLPHSLAQNLFATRMKAVMDSPEVGEELSKHFLYWYCGIQSRRDLDFKPKSFNEFVDVRENFHKWSASRQ